MLLTIRNDYRDLLLNINETKRKLRSLILYASSDTQSHAF